MRSDKSSPAGQGRGVGVCALSEEHDNDYSRSAYEIGIAGLNQTAVPLFASDAEAAKARAATTVASLLIALHDFRISSHCSVSSELAFLPGGAS